jgi:proton-translocating NADH-quinone oxidoreductase chain M
MLILYPIIFITIIELLAFLFQIRNRYLRQLSFIRFSATLLATLLSVQLYTFNKFHYQYLITLTLDNTDLNLSYSVGIDGLSLLFLFLTTLLIFLCFLFLWPVYTINSNYNFLLNFLLLILIFIFITLDILLFYVFFEASLVPMFFMIGMEGSRERKMRAAYLLLFFTLFGSFFFLMGILYLYCLIGGTSFDYLQLVYIPYDHQLYLWILFFLAFACKIPVFPFHIWLPEAHVEAPTVGSVILAGVLLKLGIYGFIRFNLTAFPHATTFYYPLLAILCVCGIIYGSLTAIRQTDLKRIIAYSSVAHMNLIVLGLSSGTFSGIVGGILQSVSHGFVSSALFFLVGMIYNRYHSRSVNFYNGIVHVMPIYTFFFFVFTFSNIALPPSSSFVGEFLILNGIYKCSSILCFLSTTGVVLSSLYSLWLYNRISFGNVRTLGTLKFMDLTLQEIVILVPLFFFVVLMGLSPDTFYKFFAHTVQEIIQIYKIN